MDLDRWFAVIGALGVVIGAITAIISVRIARAAERRAVKAERLAMQQAATAEKMNQRRRAPHFRLFAEPFNNFSWPQPERWGHDYAISVWHPRFLYPQRLEVDAAVVREEADEDVYLPIVNVGEPAIRGCIKAYSDDASLRVMEIKERSDVYLVTYRYRPEEHGKEILFVLTISVLAGFVYHQTYRSRHGVFESELIESKVVDEMSSSLHL